VLNKISSPLRGEEVSLRKRAGGGVVSDGKRKIKGEGKINRVK